MKKGLLAILAAALLVTFLSGCRSNVRYNSANKMVQTNWDTPFPAWKFTPNKPYVKCGPPGGGRFIYVEDGYYSSYREFAVNAADWKLDTVKINQRPSFGDTTLFNAFENGYSRHAEVKGCDNSGFIGLGRVYVASSKVYRSVTWQCRGSATCTKRQHGPWKSGWK